MTNADPDMELSSAQPHPFNGQVEALQRLVLKSGPEQGDYDEVCTQAAAELDKIASKLRDSSQRAPFAQTELPALLATIVSAKPTGSAAQQKLWQQAGRAAANLCADCDLARERLAKHKYAPAVLRLLQGELPHDVAVPLTASLLNYTNDKLPDATAALDNHAALTGLLSLTRSAPDAEWLWAIADNVVPAKPAYALAAADFAPFPPTFRLDTDADAFPASLAVVKHAAGVLERFAAADALDAALLQDRAALEPMLDFVEHAELPADVEDREETDKELGMAKASAARTLVFLMSEAAPPAWLWQRVEAWFDQDAATRPDLVSCALLAYGNRARSDAASTATLRSPSLLPRLVHLLDPSSPLIVQHALLGLLRNLSIPEANRQPLGDAGVIEGIVAMGPWSEQRDVVGAVQGAAIGAIKALVRDPPNSSRFAKTAGPAELLALLGRTSDPAIALEATRVFVNAIRALARSASSDLAAYTSAEALAAVAGLLSAPYPVLLNEGLVALSLASLTAKTGVQDALLRPSRVQTGPAPPKIQELDEDGREGKIGEGEGEGEKGAKRVPLDQTSQARPVDKLAEVLVPAPERSDAFGPEIQANAATLVRSVGGDVEAFIKRRMGQEAEVLAVDQ